MFHFFIQSLQFVSHRKRRLHCPVGVVLLCNGAPKRTLMHRRCTCRPFHHSVPQRRPCVQGTGSRHRRLLQHRFFRPLGKILMSDIRIVRSPFAAQTESCPPSASVLHEDFFHYRWSNILPKRILDEISFSQSAIIRLKPLPIVENSSVE